MLLFLLFAVAAVVVVVVVVRLSRLLTPASFALRRFIVSLLFVGDLSFIVSLFRGCFKLQVVSLFGLFQVVYCFIVASSCCLFAWF